MLRRWRVRRLVRLCVTKGQLVGVRGRQRTTRSSPMCHQAAAREAAVREAAREAVREAAVREAAARDAAVRVSVLLTRTGWMSSSRL